MRIAVICGSLLPGRDGVGDYTRCLVGACGDAHEFLLLSLRDQERIEETLPNGKIKRFRRALIRPQSAEEVIEAVNEFEPDVVSLQFVPFGYDPKGIIRNLIPLIKDIVGPRALHIMFHELWLGEKPSLPLKHKILGFAQKRLIKRALCYWKPVLLHTSNPLYRDVLARNGYRAQVLPLFGNIPIAEPSSVEVKKLLPWYPCQPNERILLFPFSQSRSWKSRKVMEILAEAAEVANVSLKLIQVGKNPYSEYHWPRIKLFAKNRGWSCDILGPRSEAKLSQLMFAADVGISSAHQQLAGKSGAIVGMLEHGLPVICSSLDIESKFDAPLSNDLRGLHSLEQPIEQIADVLKNPRKETPQSRLHGIAKKWIDDFQTLS
ncbi:MAG: hypothetical protein AAGH40_10900 [Verrucomicrobiota bacterium]